VGIATRTIIDAVLECTPQTWPWQAFRSYYIRLHSGSGLGRGRPTNWCRSARPISDSTDEELLQIDRFVRRQHHGKNGPYGMSCMTPDQGLVLEVAFEGLARSPRHKSASPMRFPRINRLRWDKPPREADDWKAGADGLKAEQQFNPCRCDH